MQTIAIVGAGPAGIMAALHAKTPDNKVLLIERNQKIGRKLSITGKGRCNLTNDADISEFFEQVNTNSVFLYSALYSYTNRDLIEYLNRNGLETKVERGGRVFPKSDKAVDVIALFQDLLKKKGIETILPCTVETVKHDGLRYQIKTNRDLYFADKLILTTGGMSYPKTGSDGRGYRFAEEFGHSIIRPKGALVPIVLEEDWIESLAGVSLRNVQLRLTQGKRMIREEFGEMLFTHFGISGPIVLTMSTEFLPEEEYTIQLDLKPALTEEQLDRRILSDLEKYKNKQMKNALCDLTLQALIPVLLKLAEIDEDKPAHQLTREERKRLLGTFKGIRMRAIGLRPIAEAIVTSGGILIDEINPSTMESKLQPGLYFAGEIIDVDANTGGYNLQIAFSTGYLAGVHASGKENKS